MGAGLAHLIKVSTGGDTIAKWPSVLGVALAIALTRPISAYINRPTADSVMRDLEASEPAYAALRVKQPAVYAQIKNDVAASLENGDPPSTLRSKMRQVISALYVTKLPKASDKNLILVAQILRDETEVLGKNDPSLCVAMLGPQGADLGSSLPPDLTKRDQDMMTQVINGDDVSDPKTASQVEVQKFAIGAFQNIAKTLRVPVQQAAAASQGKGPDDLKCNVTSRLMSELTKLPDQEAAPMIRAIMFSK